MEEVTIIDASGNVSLGVLESTKREYHYIKLWVNGDMEAEPTALLIKDYTLAPGWAIQRYIDSHSLGMDRLQWQASRQVAEQEATATVMETVERKVSGLVRKWERANPKPTGKVQAKPVQAVDVDSFGSASILDVHFSEIEEEPVPQSEIDDLLAETLEATTLRKETEEVALTPVQPEEPVLPVAPVLPVDDSIRGCHSKFHNMACMQPLGHEGSHDNGEFKDPFVWEEDEADGSEEIEDALPF